MAPFDREALASAYERAMDRDTTAQDRGRALEDFAAASLAAVPGVTVVARNDRDVFQSQEIDVFCENEGMVEGLTGFGRYIIVESKNWSAPVGAMEVAWLDTKLRMRGLSDGVLLALNGITGDRHSLTGAREIITAALREGRRILVIRPAEVNELDSGEDLARVLKREAARLHSRKANI